MRRSSTPEMRRAIERARKRRRGREGARVGQSSALWLGKACSAAPGRSFRAVVRSDETHSALASIGNAVDPKPEPWKCEQLQRRRNIGCAKQAFAWRTCPRNAATCAPPLRVRLPQRVPMPSCPIPAARHAPHCRLQRAAPRLLPLSAAAASGRTQTCAGILHPPAFWAVAPPRGTTSTHYSSLLTGGALGPAPTTPTRAPEAAAARRRRRELRTFGGRGEHGCAALRWPPPRQPKSPPRASQAPLGGGATSIGRAAGAARRANCDALRVQYVFLLLCCQASASCARTAAMTPSGGTNCTVAPTYDVV